MDLRIYSESFLLAAANNVLNLLVLRTIFILACVVLHFSKKNTICTRQEKQNKIKYPVFGSHE